MEMAYSTFTISESNMGALLLQLLLSRNSWKSDKYMVSNTEKKLWFFKQKWYK